MSLAALMPELVADVEGALVHLGRGDLADQVRAARIHGWTRDAFAQTTDLHLGPVPESPGEIYSLFDQVGVNLELDGAGTLARLEVSGYEPILARLEDPGARRALFRGEGFRAVEMFAFDVPRLQAFYEANPLYHATVSGAPAKPGDAQEAFDARPPQGWAYTRKWMLFFVDDAGQVVGMADLLADLFAPGVWHVGLFIVATALHGTGRTHAMYTALEAWMKARGARWSRLGVVDGNPGGRRFWERVGYTERRERPGYEVGGREHLLHVMAKPLGAADWERYRRLVPRDDPAAD